MAPPSALPSPTGAPTATPPVDAIEKPFALAIKFTESESVAVLGDTIGVLTRSRDEDGLTTRVAAFELKAGRFEKIGEHAFKVHEYVRDLTRVGDTTYIETITPVYRSGVLELVPIAGRGKRQNLGDPNLENYYRYQTYRGPECEEPRREGVTSMSSIDELIEIGKDRALIFGDACDGSPVLAIVDKTKATKKTIAVPATARVFETHFGVVVDDETKVLIVDSRGEVTETSIPTLPARTYTVVKAPDGSFIASTPTESFIARGPKWVSLALADGKKAFSLHPGDSTLWAFVGNDTDAVEIHKFLGPGEAAPALADTKALAAPTQKPVPATAGPSFPSDAPGPKCKKNLVVLYGFTKVTPDDYDFPLTRKAVKGHLELTGVRFVVAEELGKKYLVGMAQSFDQASRLARVIESGVKGSKPQILCTQPKELRELAIDLKTGNVK
ncbi:MAG: hypothetical protein HOV80_34090 [Polyangiaceae bacterium]|nr:hypothetical protein [Polyangiaceae bacterium]